MYSSPSPKVDKRRTKVEGGDAIKGIAGAGAGISATMGGAAAQENPSRQPEEEGEQPQLSKWVALFTLAASTACVAICAEFMVDSINAITESGTVSRTFVGLILLPIVGNAAEHATAVTVACKDKMDLAIGVAVGSSMQIALLVIPFVVVLGWIMGNDKMNLAFDGFQIAVLFVAVLLVNYLIQDGKSHWSVASMVLSSSIHLLSLIQARRRSSPNPIHDYCDRGMVCSSSCSDFTDSANTLQGSTHQTTQRPSTPDNHSPLRQSSFNTAMMGTTLSGAQPNSSARTLNSAGYQAGSQRQPSLGALYAGIPPFDL